MIPFGQPQSLSLSSKDDIFSNPIPRKNIVDELELPTDLEPGEVIIPDNSLSRLNNRREAARRLGPGTSVIMPDRTMRIISHQQRNTLVEHIEPIYTETCSVPGNNKRLNSYGKKLLSKYKNKCSNNNAPWKFNPCTNSDDIDVLEEQSEQYYLCGSLRRRFTKVCVIKGDNEHDFATKKQKKFSEDCQKKILHVQRKIAQSRKSRIKRTYRTPMQRTTFQGRITPIPGGLYLPPKMKQKKTSYRDESRPRQPEKYQLPPVINQPRQQTQSRQQTQPRQQYQSRQQTQPIQKRRYIPSLSSTPNPNPYLYQAPSSTQQIKIVPSFTNRQTVSPVQIYPDMLSLDKRNWRRR